MGLQMQQDKAAEAAKIAEQNASVKEVMISAKVNREGWSVLKEAALDGLEQFTDEQREAANDLIDLLDGKVKAATENAIQAATGERTFQLPPPDSDTQ